MEKGRIIAFDYGSKRTGIAVSDPLQLIASPLDTMHPANILPWLGRYRQTEHIAAFVVGEPRQMDNSPSETFAQVEAFVRMLKKNFPEIAVHRVVERSSSKMAVQSLIDSGARLSERRKKGNIDMVSATLLLQIHMAGHS